MATITNRNIGQIRAAFSFYYPDNSRDFKDGPLQSEDFSWKNQIGFSEFVFNETKIAIKSAKDYANIKAAQLAFEKRATTPEKAVEEDMPKNLEAMKAASEKREAERQKGIEESKAAVRRAIETQKENYEKLKAQKEKIYVKAESALKPEVSGKAREFITQAKQSPKEYIEALTNDIEKSISPQLEKQLTKEQIHLVARDTAYKAVDAANYPDKYIKMAKASAILNAASKEEAVVPRVVGTQTLPGVRTAASEVAAFQNMQTFTPRVVFSAFSPELADSLFPDPQSFQVTFSARPTPGYTDTFDPAGLTQGYVGFLDNQMGVISQVSSLPADMLRSEIIGRADGWIEGQIASRFPQISAVFSSTESRVLFGSLGIGSPITIELPTAMSAFFVENPAALPVVNFFGSSMGINFGIGSSAAAATGEAIAVTGAEGIATAGAAGISVAGAEAAGVAAAPVTGGLSLVVTAAAAIVGPKVIKLVKDNVSKYGKYIVAGVGAVLGAAIGSSAGIGAITGGLVGGVTGLGISSFVGGGVPAVQASLSGLGSGIAATVGAVFATFLAGIGTPILALLLGFPLVVALILFIINSGAYLVPPGMDAESSANPYISVTKTANPAGQIASPTTITYTVAIAAKKDNLSGITINSTCNVINKNASIPCPGEDIPSPPESINAGTPFSFSYAVNFDSRHKDSLISNTITVSAVSPSGGEVSEVGSTSVCFGECPLDCFAFPDQYWRAGDAQDLKSLMTQAAATLVGQYPNFAQKACTAGTVNICFNPGAVDSSFYGWHEHGRNSICDIDFNIGVLKTGPSGVLNLLTHEISHHISTISPGYLQQFKDRVYPREPSVCTYGGTDAAESFAEGNALFVTMSNIYRGCSPPLTTETYRTRYPLHYNFAKDKIFGP
ncbi:MAG TPA: hypothetical protein VJ227_03880 [Patescibacteria group bacterium]|nr:hypothetical protein [Patescibacteria group bacterium]